MIDLRSDTVTKPTAAMRRAMAEAEVGDDVYGEDPTVNRLQERAAELFEKEAALFVPTGSMGNQIAVKLHTRPGTEVVIEERGHIYNYEMAAMAAVSGALARPVKSSDGTGVLAWDDIAGALHVGGAYYVAPTALVALENSHNLAGGTLMTRARTEEICARAHAAGLAVHLDGARVFNAAAALGERVAALARPVDSVMFCLSKGLGAPVGSMLLGTRAFVEEARAWRKLLGGGMRQAGVLAAAGLVALEESPPRLVEDHRERAPPRRRRRRAARLPDRPRSRPDQHRHLRRDRHRPHVERHLRAPPERARRPRPRLRRRASAWSRTTTCPATTSSARSRRSGK